MNKAKYFAKTEVMSVTHGSGQRPLTFHVNLVWVTVVKFGNVLGYRYHICGYVADHGFSADNMLPISYQFSAQNPYYRLKRN